MEEENKNEETKENNNSKNSKINENEEKSDSNQVITNNLYKKYILLFIIEKIHFNIRHKF